MKKTLLLLIIGLFFTTPAFTYDIQPWDNALLTKIYDRIDEKMIADYDDMLVLEQSMDYLMLRYGNSEKNEYFLTKIHDYLRERLYRATSSSTFVCINEHTQNNDTVTISYNLTTEEGKNISLSKGEYTLQETTDLLFNPGKWSVPEGVEEAVLWMKLYETTWVAISHRDAYGSHDWHLLIELPRQAVEEISPQTLEIDQRVTMNILVWWKTMKKEWFIKEITIESVLVDFNEPLAGHGLLWVITIEWLFKSCQN